MSGTGGLSSSGTPATDQRVDLPCREFSEFKSALQQARTTDDKIVYNLNTSVPTESFAGQVSAKERCMSLHHELVALHKERNRAISHCIETNTAEVQAMKDKMASHSESDPVYLSIKKKLGMHLRKLRLMQSELVVEEAVQERSMKVFRERCWKSYRPPNDE